MQVTAGQVVTLAQLHTDQVGVRDNDWPEQVISQELETGHIEAAQTVSIGDMVYMVLRGLDTAPDLHSEPFSNICIALGGECPVGPLARSVWSPGDLDEAIVEAEIVTERVLPSLGVLAIVERVERAM